MAAPVSDILWSRTTERLVAGNTTSSEHNATIVETAVGLNITWNVSVPEGCIPVRFDLMEYLPWDNPDNIVSAEFENMARKIRYISMPFFFMIGGPTNVINMLVFYKQGLKERVNLCLFALSLADLLDWVHLMSVLGEQTVLQFTTEEVYGPVLRFMFNNNLGGFHGFSWVSQILSAIIATERCLCVLRPLRFQTLLKTRTMAAIIIVVYVVTVGLYFVVHMRYRIECIFDLITGTVNYVDINADGTFRQGKEVPIFLDTFIFGIGIPSVVVTVVTTTTIITGMKIRQAAAWRAGTSSASGHSSSSSLSISPQEVALTKMLIGIAVLFVVFISPQVVFRFACLAFPEMDVGGRKQNFYVGVMWSLEIFMNVNSSFNFFVYYIIGTRYRETFWALFGRKKKSEARKRSAME